MNTDNRMKCRFGLPRLHFVIDDKARAVLAICLATMSMVASAGCPSIKEREAYRACMKRFDAIQHRIYVTTPSRRSGPLRQINLNDIEVREITAAARAVVPEAIVNISGVTEGCPCEDGPKCEDEVWLIASTSAGSKELKLSKIEEHWMIGPIQQWWLRYEKFKETASDDLVGFDRWQAEIDIKMEFPACLGAERAL